MLRRFLGGRGTAPGWAAPAPERATYAVGDIHGRADLLETLLARIAADVEERGGPADLVFLGDYVDRGPDSRAVLERLAALGPGPWHAPICLMGNHERLMLDFLADPLAGPWWLGCGGAATLASFGIEAARDEADPATLAGLARALDARLGDMRGFIEGLALTHLSGTLLIAHAGADPDRPPEAQPEEALLWGRSAIRRRPRGDGIWTLHGHFKLAEPEIAPGRIAVDTGAWQTGRLTAARIGPDGVAFLST